MASLMQRGNSWVVFFNLNGKTKQRTFKNRNMAEKIYGLLQGWKELQKSKEFIKLAMSQGLMNESQKNILERYIDFKLEDLTDAQQIQIKALSSQYKPIMKPVICLDCSTETKNFGRGRCKKCYMALYRRELSKNKLRRRKKEQNPMTKEIEGEPNDTRTDR